MKGQVSQSFQIAPFDWEYNYNNGSGATTIYDDSLTKFNTYKGGPLQEAVSAVTYVQDANYVEEGGYGVYGYEYWSDPDHVDDGYISWVSEGKESWKITSQSIGPNDEAMVSQRLIPEEPMYAIINLGIAPGFQAQDFMHLEFPATMYVDYVRIYQREGIENGVTCDPPNRPTVQYIDEYVPGLSCFSFANIPLSVIPRHTVTQIGLLGKKQATSSREIQC